MTDFNAADEPRVSDAQIAQVAERHVARAIRALDEALDEAELGAPEALKDAPRLLADLRKAMQAVFDERKRIDELIRKQGGDASGGADLDAIRAQIIGLLDRLKGPQDTRGLSK